MPASNDSTLAPSRAITPPAPLGGLDALKAEKLSWYQEVLGIEPGSKIFLSYARLLAELGNHAEAVRVLQAGLDNHPEYTEARLFLINLLHRQGDNAACGAEVARLAGLFREYPDFWDAWSHFTEDKEERGDLSVSLGMLGAMLRDKNVTLVDVLASGLRSIQGAGIFSAPKNSPDPIPAGASPQASSLSTGQTSTHASAHAPEHEDPALKLMEEFPQDLDAEKDRIPPFVFGQDAVVVDDSVKQEEKCSLRTRSMAEVLAEQGDLRGAVEIYEELLASAASEDTEELADRLEQLKSKLGEAETLPVRSASASSSGSAPIKVPGSKASTGVFDLLEKLALRLENKSRQ